MVHRRIKNRRFDTKRLKQTADPVPTKAPKRIADRPHGNPNEDDQMISGDAIELNKPGNTF